MIFNRIDCVIRCNSYKVIFYFKSKMEWLSIPIFEKFSIVSIVMPYYGLTHEIFLVLSVLSANIRRILIEHYEEFRKCMLKHAKVKEMEIKDLKEMKLPLDLFVFLIHENSCNKGVRDLIAFVDTSLLYFFIITKHNIYIFLL